MKVSRRVGDLGKEGGDRPRADGGEPRAFPDNKFEVTPVFGTAAHGRTEHNLQVTVVGCRQAPHIVIVPNGLMT